MDNFHPIPSCSIDLHGPDKALIYLPRIFSLDRNHKIHQIRVYLNQETESIYLGLASRDYKTAMSSLNHQRN